MHPCIRLQTTTSGGDPTSLGQSAPTLSSNPDASHLADSDWTRLFHRIPTPREGVLRSVEKSGSRQVHLPQKRVFGGIGGRFRFAPYSRFVSFATMLRESGGGRSPPGIHSTNSGVG